MHSLDDRGAAAGQEIDDDRHDSEHEEHMNDASDGVHTADAEEPSHEKNCCNQPQDVAHSDLLVKQNIASAVPCGSPRQNGAAFAIAVERMPRHSILIVETDVQISVAFELFFTGHGYDVRVANGTREAMAFAAHAGCDVILIGNLADLVDAGTLVHRLRAMSGPATQVVLLAHTIDVAEADLVMPMGTHPRAILDGVRTLARRRVGVGDRQSA
jgi:CheY-like chemotaxis protein